MKSMMMRSVALMMVTAATASLSLMSTASAQTDPYGRWLAEDIFSGGVIDRLQTTLDLAPDGRATGFGGCNSFTGRANITGQNVSFGPLASTRKACTPAVMDQEQKFHKAVEAATAWRIEQTKLVLTNASGDVVAKLTRLDSL